MPQRACCVDQVPSPDLCTLFRCLLRAFVRACFLFILSLLACAGVALSFDTACCPCTCSSVVAHTPVLFLSTNDTPNRNATASYANTALLGTTKGMVATEALAKTALRKTPLAEFPLGELQHAFHLIWNNNSGFDVVQGIHMRLECRGQSGPGPQVRHFHTRLQKHENRNGGRPIITTFPNIARAQTHKPYFSMEK